MRNQGNNQLQLPLVPQPQEYPGVPCGSASPWSGAEPFLAFPEPQSEACFLGRPQRFLAEMRLMDGTKTFAYCANPGSLEGCLEAGSLALLWKSPNGTKRKRPYTWRALRHSQGWLGTDTHLSNRLAEKLLRQGIVPGLGGYELLAQEPRLARGLRLDFLLQDGDRKCYVEVKSALVADNGEARYPDSATCRAVKQLKCLAKLAKTGSKALLLFIVQRGDVSSFTVNARQPSEFLDAYVKAVKVGVDVFAFAFPVSPVGFGQPRLLPVRAFAVMNNSSSGDLP